MFPLFPGTTVPRRGLTTWETSALAVPLTSGIITIAGYPIWEGQITSSKYKWTGKLQRIQKEFVLNHKDCGNSPIPN